MAPEEDRDLAAFQAALLELLASGLPPEEMQRRLRQDPAFTPYRSYVERFELRTLETAAALVKKWGRRDGQPRGPGPAGRPF